MPIAQRTEAIGRDGPSANQQAQLKVQASPALLRNDLPLYGLAKLQIAGYCTKLRIADENPCIKDPNMPDYLKIALALVVAVLAGLSTPASARERQYPLTRCGPDLAFLCPIHGYFDAPPFHYNLAIYPGCIKRVPVKTAHGVERRRAIVCDMPQRPMIWW